MQCIHTRPAPPLSPRNAYTSRPIKALVRRCAVLPFTLVRARQEGVGYGIVVVLFAWCSSPTRSSRRARFGRVRTAVAKERGIARGLWGRGTRDDLRIGRPQ